jgi:hypothetical protein
LEKLTVIQLVKKFPTLKVGTRRFIAMKFEVLMAVKMTTFFWVVLPCGLVGEYQRFGETVLSPSSGLKTETVCFSEMLVSTYKST